MKQDINKATYADLRYQASNMNLGYMVDRDEEFIYFEYYCPEENCPLIKRYSYTWVDGVLSVDGASESEVIRETSYKPTKSILEKEVSKVKALVEKLLNKRDIVKQFNDKSYEVVEPLYIPFGKVDAHGDAYKSKDGPYQLVESFNTYKDSMQKAINHTHSTNCFGIVEAWVSEKGFTLDTGVEVADLQPLVKLRYTKKAYELRKEGRLLGPSIGCTATVQEVAGGLKQAAGQAPLRVASSFDFSKKRHHLSLTTPSVGGPASQEEWFIDMSKSSLSKEDLALLEELGEEYTELEKKLAVYDQEQAPSTSDKGAQDAGVDTKNLNEGKDSKMSEISKAEFEALQKELATLKADKAKSEVGALLVKYSLSEDVQKSLVPALTTVEDVSVFTAALDEVLARLEASLKEKSDLEKSLQTSPQKEATALEKALLKEEGQSADLSKKSDELTDEKLKQYREIK